MDRIEEKIESTLKTIVDAPPDTLTNMVMSRVRAPKKKPAMFWVGIASTLACAAVITVIVTTNGLGSFKNQASVPMESAETANDESAGSYAAKAAPPGKGDDSATGLTSSAPGDKDAGNPGSSDKERSSQKKQESKPATKEEIDQLTKPIGKSLQTESSQLPQVNVVSKSKNPETTWSTVRDKSMAYSSMITNEIIGDKNMPAAKKTYKLHVILSRSYFKGWSEMVMKNAGSVTGVLSIPQDGDSFNVTVTFEPSK